MTGPSRRSAGPSTSSTMLRNKLCASLRRRANVGRERGGGLQPDRSPRSDPWLAMDVATAPTLRAQELRFAWERFVEELERSDDGTAASDDPELVRATIADSWRRSFAAGVEPTGGRLAPVVAAEDETETLWEEHPLSSALPL